MTTVNGITAHTARQASLGELVWLRAGYSFRSAIPERPDGNVLAVQLRDFQGRPKPDWSTVARTRLERDPGGDEWLRPGDILFPFRGTRYYAAMLEGVPGAAVASNQFMLMRVLSAEVLPAFLVWQLNQPPAQRHFEQWARGTAQRSLRRAEIEALRIAIPPLAFQQSVVELARLSQSEREALEELIRLREQQLHSISESLFGAATQVGKQ